MKPGSVDIAMLCARPIPDSSIPPHHTGMPRFLAKCSIARAAACPPTRPSLILMMRHAAEFHGVLRVGRGVDRLIEADRRAQLALQRRVIDEVARRQRLLDHQKTMSIELLHHVEISIERIGGVRIDRKDDVGKFLRTASTRATSFPGLILILIR